VPTEGAAGPGCGGDIEIAVVVKVIHDQRERLVQPGCNDDPSKRRWIANTRVVAVPDDLTRVAPCRDDVDVAVAIEVDGKGLAIVWRARDDRV
jgi:hypothetical protein